jgi:4-hydroxy-3-polyprenylbenzoate decarboxylase
MQTFPALGEFVRYLESIGELRRIKKEVDPFLEITEIAARSLREGRQALLFENVKGSPFPCAVNVYASERRIEIALGRHPEQIGEELINFAERLFPPKPSELWKNRSMLLRILHSQSRKVASGFSQSIVLSPDLNVLPLQTCWPGDGGRFITQGQVVTYDPVDGKRNIGMYRMHVYDAVTTGMHWQIQKGGGFHYHHAEQMNRALPVCVALGTDPALLLATIAALPEGIDEAMFAAFLRNKRIPFARGKSIGVDVPSRAEFILEGNVYPGERREEGPFGDHLGHYSHASLFPVFHLKALTHRHHAVYPAAVVGVPPLEDKFLGDATQQILSPLIRLLHSEIRSMWAYYEAGFHNLLVVSTEARYKKEAMKTALGLLGTGQLSLTKCMVLVSEEVDPKNWSSVLKEIHENFDPHFDFMLLPNVPLDTLDFTSFNLELGSKMILDATRKQSRKHEQKKRDERITGLKRSLISKVISSDKRIIDAESWEETLLVVKIRSSGSVLSGSQLNGRPVLEKLLRNRECQIFSIIAVVSEDVDVRDRVNSIWGIFTRFDCQRDVIFTDQKMSGISPLYSGVMGIDATWKKGYPDPLVMDPDVVCRVHSQWEEFWK